MAKIIIVDGHYFLWRSWSVPFKFSSKKGTPLHVVTMCLKLLRRALTLYNKTPKEENYLAVVFDTEGINDNFNLSADYKATRKTFKTEEDSPYSHLPYIKKALKYLKIGFVEHLGVEADDVIASLATGFCAKNSGNKAYIVSADSDFYQLLSRQIMMLNLKSNGVEEIVTPQSLKSKLGITPQKYVEFKSLVGDSADNIKGVCGIGKLTARKIVNKEIRFDLSSRLERLELNRKLITLNRNCRIRWPYKKLIYKDKILSLTNKQVFEACGF